MRKTKTISGTLAFQTALPVLLLTAAVTLFLTFWMLDFPSDHEAPSIQPYTEARESRSDPTAFDRETYARFANRSDENTLRVSIAATDDGEVIFREQVGYAVYLSDRARIEGAPDRFLVLDRDSMAKRKEPPAFPEQILAVGRDDGFYFYADFFETAGHGEVLSLPQMSDGAERDVFRFESAETQSAELVVPEFVWRNPMKSIWGIAWPDRDDRWELYVSFCGAVQADTVVRVENQAESFGLLSRKSVCGGLFWQAYTYETVYPNYLPGTGVHLYTHAYERPLPAALETSWRVALVLLVAAVLLVLHVHLLIKQGVALPLAALTEKAAAIAEPDTWFGKDELERPDELGELARALKKAEAAFQEKWDSERALERKRQDFVAAASHDLKTPLALIGGYVEAVQQNIAPAENARYLDSIEREAGKMNRLVLEMLSYTRLDRMTELENGRRENLAALLGVWLDEAAPLFEGRSLARDLPERLFVRCDAALLRRAVDNLLSNAARFTPAGGAVGVTLSVPDSPAGGSLLPDPDRKSFCLSVENDGEPIPEGELERIFEMFYRTDRARTRGDAGNGVGLAAAKRICELHGFTLCAENTRSGVRFRIEG